MIRLKAASSPKVEIWITFEFDGAFWMIHFAMFRLNSYCAYTIYGLFLISDKMLSVQNLEFLLYLYNRFDLIKPSYLKHCLSIGETMSQGSWWKKSFCVWYLPDAAQWAVFPRKGKNQIIVILRLPKKITYFLTL